MSLIALIATAAISFGFLLIVFRPLELAFPAKPNQPLFRQAWLTDLFFFLGQYLLWNGLVVGLLLYFSRCLDDVIPSGFRRGVASQPWWLQVIEVVFLSDLLVYWGHRLQHRVGFLWRFHSVHHSAEHLDWLAAHREHPLDTIFTMGLINLPAFVFGFPLETIIGFITFRGIWAIFIHSNVRVPLGPLRMLLGSPGLHHWHHECSRDSGNYANISPLMDILFGTYRCPDHEPARLGLPERQSHNYLAYMIKPLLPTKRSAKRSASVPTSVQGSKPVETVLAEPIAV